VFGLSAAAALCATATSAQDPPPHNYHGFATQVAWDATLGADGSFENVLAGRYTDDVLLDVVVQKGTQLVLFADTAQQHVYSPFGAEALDAVRWPGSSTDAIIASEATGATVYSWTARLQI
jgi:hypothetical protein